MRLLLRCWALGVAVALLVGAAALFATGRLADFAFMLMSPALSLTDWLFGSVIATSDSGPVNFIALVLAGCLLNMAFCTGFFFLVFKVGELVRRKTTLRTPPENRQA